MTKITQNLKDGDVVNDTHFQQIKDVVNANAEGNDDLSAFQPIIDFSKGGVYNDYTLAADIIITAENITDGKSQYVVIIGDDTKKVSLGSGMELISGSVGVLQAGTNLFYFQSIKGKVQVSQRFIDALTALQAVTIDSSVVGTNLVTLNITNPNSSNELFNKVYYKLSADTVWTGGISFASGATQAIQTGLTNDVAYDFKIVAAGDGIQYQTSVDSNTVSATPTLSSSNLLSIAVLDSNPSEMILTCDSPPSITDLADFTLTEEGISAQTRTVALSSVGAISGNTIIITASARFYGDNIYTLSNAKVAGSNIASFTDQAIDTSNINIQFASLFAGTTPDAFNSIFAAAPAGYTFTHNNGILINSDGTASEGYTPWLTRTKKLLGSDDFIAQVKGNVDFGGDAQQEIRMIDIVLTDATGTEFVQLNSKNLTADVQFKVRNNETGITQETVLTGVPVSTINNLRIRKLGGTVYAELWDGSSWQSKASIVLSKTPTSVIISIIQTRLNVDPVSYSVNILYQYISKNTYTTEIPS